MLSIIILSNSKNDYLKAITDAAIASLKNAELPKEKPFNEIRILVVESAAGIAHQNVIQIQYDWKKYPEFNFNYALNQGVEFLKSSFSDNDWWCFSNNDIVFDRNWLTEIDRVHRQCPQLESLCRNPDILLKKNAVKVGYVLGEHLVGCCILSANRIIDQVIHSFDEAFSYYFPDDDYLEVLKANNVQHGKVMSSIIHHLESQTPLNSSHQLKLLLDGKNTFIKKYGNDVYAQNEYAKTLYRQKLSQMRDFVLNAGIEAGNH